MNHVMEGFLCPVCKSDLGDLELLQQHVNEHHSSLQNGGHLTRQIKGLFGRARQQLKSNLDNFVSEYENKSDEFREEFHENVLGLTTSHTADFHKTRDQKIDQLAVETNKLIIRLDKLVSNCPDDPFKRRGIQKVRHRKMVDNMNFNLEFEQSVTSWEVSSTYCPHCRSRFSIAKRKHHCRLCGKTMCNNCSNFLSFSYANRLTNPAVAAGYDSLSASTSKHKDVAQETSPIRVKTKATRLLKGTISVLKGDELSWNSMFDQEGEAQLRTCIVCKELLERREQQMDRRTSSPSICQFYESLSRAVQQAAALFPNYNRMAQSLNQGESTYNLEMAKEVKLKLLQTQQQIDTLSKTILNQGLQSGATVTQRQLLLQRNIRSFAANLLQEMIVAMPTLPDAHQYKRLQENYKINLKQKIKMERESVSHHNLKTLAPSSNASSMARSLSYTANEAAESGWTPDVSVLADKKKQKNKNAFDEDFVEAGTIDPLLQQIQMIRSYLAQAVQAGRVDEVEMLENNLHELEAEYKVQNV